MKIVTIVGARPQFVKAAVLSRAINEYNKRMGDGVIEEVIVHTGQHFDENMSDVFFNQMDIPRPQYNLMINNLSHGAMTGMMLTKIEEVLQKECPDWVLVYGDTNSTLAGALAAKKIHIKVAHVEAGLRSFNMLMPEEINRVLTDRMSDLLFCPTETAVLNLKVEGFDKLNSTIVQCGDVMYDAAIYYTKQATKPQEINENEQFVLSTIHRQENTDDGSKLASIFEALSEIAAKQKIILPLHPRTIKKIEQFNITPAKDIQIIEPVGYFEIIWLLSHCSCVVTDSGGLQKEAFFFKKPCITVREETEWVELIQHNVNFLTGSNKGQITRVFGELGDKNIDFDVNLYGEGNTGQIIVEELLSFQR
ncbi:non-hydrolyzing UDP-N-acetylglucosamine 2-epimerase [Flagellimonas sp.]|uniref:non-hydrolyzing UDP-N-acetylglucosamine 2-epimerase n=1 Tax=Flagellimonas sp. TaxID=2058762 RepID=UPI003AB5308B